MQANLLYVQPRVERQSLFDVARSSAPRTPLACVFKDGAEICGKPAPRHPTRPEYPLIPSLYLEPLCPLHAAFESRSATSSGEESPPSFETDAVREKLLSLRAKISRVKMTMVLSSVMPRSSSSAARHKPGIASLVDQLVSASIGSTNQPSAKQTEANED